MLTPRARGSRFGSRSGSRGGSGRLRVLGCVAGLVLSACPAAAQTTSTLFTFWKSRLGSAQSTTYNGMYITMTAGGSVSVRRLSDGHRMVVSPDGTERHDYPDGRVLIKYPDGRQSLTYPSGTRVVTHNGNKITYFANGREEHQLADGRVIIKTPTGAISQTETRPNGIRIWTYRTGQVVWFFPNGIKKTYYPNGTIITGTWVTSSGSGGPTGPGGSPLSPAAPTNLEVLVNPGGEGLRLEWHDHAWNESNYVIERIPPFPGGGSIEIAPNMIAWADTSAPLTAEYRVAAANVAGMSAFTPWRGLASEPGEFPRLIPGDGWEGATEQPAAVGSPGMPGYDAKAIARWDVVPYQTFDGDFHIGVVAFHMNGIDRVSFSVDDGPWTDVEEMKLNPETGVWEYTVTLRAGYFEDGPVEVRAIAWPEGAGEPRVLGGIYEWANAYKNSQWTGEHSLNLIANADGTQSEMVVSIPSGTYEWGAIPGVPANPPAGRWLVLQPAQGATVTITPGLWHPQPHMIRLRDVNITQPTRTAALRGSADDILWLDHVDFSGPGMWERTDALTAVHTFWTNSTVHDSQQGHAQQFVRNCRFERIGEDTLKCVYLVIGTTIENVGEPPAGLTWHPAVIANPIEHDNRIYYKLDILARHDAWAFRNGTHNYWEHTDVAVIDCDTEKTTSGNQLWYLGGTVTHLYVRDSRFYEFGGLSFNFRLSGTLTNPEWQFNGHNVVFENINWQDDPNWMISPYPLEGVTVRLVGQPPLP